MQNKRCGKCPACLRVERAKSTMLKVCNGYTSHVDDGTVMVWNDTLKDNPCEQEKQDAGKTNHQTAT